MNEEIKLENGNTPPSGNEESFWGGKIEEVAGRRFPEHELSPVLRAQIRRYNEWLNQVLPEDLYQEVAIFLLDHCPQENNGDKIDYRNLPKEQFIEILQSFGRHIYHFMTNYGLTAGRSHKEVSLEHGEDYDESYDIALAENFWEKYHEAGWFKEHYEKCRDVILDDRVESELEWQAFEFYLQGRNTLEIGWKMEITESKARRLLQAAIAIVHKRFDISNLQSYNIPIGKNIRLNAEIDREIRNSERIEVQIELNTPLKEIMQRFNVSKPTASRIRQRAGENNGIGWYTPDYQPKQIISKEKKEGLKTE
ncbi:hypothetical protein HY061_00980 [Candidatus Azambacteria bacterium]|nr:hypothetical protein [Candidatus Azambacteria bacterium]